MKDRVRRIADTVLYEGYVLWPYRKSALKNQRRWTFGGVFPAGWSAGHPDDPSELRAACLLECGPDTTLDVRLRFLQVVERGLRRDGRPVEELEVGGERHVAWEEATERELAAELRPAALRAPHVAAFDIPAGKQEEALAPGKAIVRRWGALRGELEVAASPVAGGVVRLDVVVRNATEWGGGNREATLRQALCSTHVVLHADGGAFASAADPPEELREAAAACEQRGLWPALAGEEGDRSTMLCAPIILPDHPEIAPESPGDLFDATEIDQLLVLSILSLTEEERQEMRAADPRTREILERTEGLSREELMRLHGTIRELGMVRRP